MKKTVALILALVLVVALFSGCGSSSSAPASSAPAANSGADSNAAPEEKSVTLRIHCDFNEDHPTSILLQEFCDHVYEETNGTVTIQPYWASLLGDYTVVFDEVVQGTIDMTFSCPSTTYGNKFNIGVLPYLAADWDELAKMMNPDSFIFKTTYDACDEIGVKLLAMHSTGAGVLATTKEVTDYGTWGTPKGILIRVPNADYFSIPFQKMGYNTQGMNWTDIFNSLQTGVIDGFVGGQAAGVYDQFRDVCTHVYYINNFYEIAMVAINKATFESLSESQQAALSKWANWVYEENCKRGPELEKETMQKLADYGLTIVVPTDEELQNLSKGCREEVWPDLVDSMIGEGGYDALMEYLATLN